MALRKPKLTVKEPKAPKPIRTASQRFFFTSSQFLFLCYVSGFVCELLTGPVHFAFMFTSILSGVLSLAGYAASAYLYSYEPPREPNGPI
jgi:hypothetical protein